MKGKEECGIKQRDWLTTLMVLCLLVAPALSANITAINPIKITKGCTCMSGDCSGSHKMSCCELPRDSCYTQGNANTCNCQITSYSGTEVSDPSYFYSGQSSSRSFSKDGRSVSSSSPCSGSINLNPLQASPAGIGPPDLDALEYLPPSAKLVFNILESNGPLTQKDLISKTELPPRTVRYALCKLKEESIIRECFYFPDARQSLYGLNGKSFIEDQIL